MKNDVIKKTHSDIILEQLVRSVARNIVVSRTSAICLRVASILALPTFCIGDAERSKIYKHLLENKKTQIRWNVTNRSNNSFVYLWLIFNTNS